MLRLLRCCPPSRRPRTQSEKALCRPEQPPRLAQQHCIHRLPAVSLSLGAPAEGEHQGARPCLELHARASAAAAACHASEQATLSCQCPPAPRLQCLHFRRRHPARRLLRRPLQRHRRGAASRGPRHLAHLSGGCAAVSGTGEKARRGWMAHGRGARGAAGCRQLGMQPRRPHASVAAHAAVLPPCHRHAAAAVPPAGWPSP